MLGDYQHETEEFGKEEDELQGKDDRTFPGLVNVHTI